MKRGAFGVPAGEVTVDVPDGVIKTYPGGKTRSSLLDAGYVGDGVSYGAFPGEREGLIYCGPGSEQKSNAGSY